MGKETYQLRFKHLFSGAVIGNHYIDTESFCCLITHDAMFFSVFLLRCQFLTAGSAGISQKESIYASEKNNTKVYFFW